MSVCVMTRKVTKAVMLAICISLYSFPIQERNQEKKSVETLPTASEKSSW
jgi:hypothetical protein